MGFAVASRILKGEKPTDCRFCRPRGSSKRC